MHPGLRTTALGFCIFFFYLQMLHSLAFEKRIRNQIIFLLPNINSLINREHQGEHNSLIHLIMPLKLLAGPLCVFRVGIA